MQALLDRESSGVSHPTPLTQGGHMARQEDNKPYLSPVVRWQLRYRWFVMFVAGPAILVLALGRKCGWW